MIIQNIQLKNYRNYKELDIDLPENGGIFEGSNGSGKTNLLEAIYFLCTGRSQRGAKKSEIINFDSDYLYSNGVFLDDNKFKITTSIGFNRKKNVVMKLNGNKINKFTEWFGYRPIISFGVDDIQIIRGSPENRRKFIDILCSQIDKQYLSSLIAYRHFLHYRNLLLSKNNNFDKIQCEIYEEKMAEAGSIIFNTRNEIILSLKNIFSDNYNIISGKKENVNIEYNPSICIEIPCKEDWKNVFYNLLSERRIKDTEMGFTSIGPHRDDINFYIDQKPAKSYGSQGQCRSLVLALKLSSISCLEKNRSDKMIFLLDDAVSELDPVRTSNVYPLIENRGQVFIATPEINRGYSNSLTKFYVSDGKIKNI